jgi:hypothetical protein
MNTHPTIDEIVNSVRNQLTDLQERARNLEVSDEAIAEQMRKLCKAANEHISLLPEDLKQELSQAFLWVKGDGEERFALDL